MEIRRSYDRLISTMGFPILVRWHLYIESAPRTELGFHYPVVVLHIEIEHFYYGYFIFISVIMHRNTRDGYELWMCQGLYILSQWLLPLLLFAHSTSTENGGRQWNWYKLTLILHLLVPSIKTCMIISNDFKYINLYGSLICFNDKRDLW